MRVGRSTNILLATILATTASAELLDSVTDAAKNQLMSTYSASMSSRVAEELMKSNVPETEAHNRAFEATRRWIHCLIDEYEEDDSDTSVAFILWLSEGKETYSSKLMRETFFGRRISRTREEAQRFLLAVQRSC